jgi:peptide chain release factor 2
VAAPPTSAAGGDPLNPSGLPNPWPSTRQNVLAQFKSDSTRSGGIFDLDRKRSRIALIDRDAGQPDFWNDQVKAQAVLKEKAGLVAQVEGFERVERGLSDARTLHELATEAADEPTRLEAEAALDAVEREVERLELQRMLSGENDHANAYMEINAGAGGTESMDWAAMLLRMYSRYSEAKGWTVEINDFVAGEEAGVKNVSIKVTGENAYGYLKAENGVHRLVRISPFDANARRQTSFASVTVYPEVDDDIVLDIPEKDVRVDVYRASGAGGQKVNKTSSAVRLTHVPTGITVAMQNERSQHANRDMAWKILRSRLYDLELQKRNQVRDEAEAQKKDIAFGSQIRSYVLAPYQLVKDLRTGVETGNVEAVLDGKLDDFITAQLLGVKNPNRASPE